MILNGSSHLSLAKVFNVNTKGTLERLQAAIGLPDVDRIVIYLNNLMIVVYLGGMLSNSLQDIFLRF